MAFEPGRAVEPSAIYTSPEGATAWLPKSVADKVFAIRELTELAHRSMPELRFGNMQTRSAAMRSDGWTDCSRIRMKAASAWPRPTRVYWNRNGCWRKRPWRLQGFGPSMSARQPCGSPAREPVVRSRRGLGRRREGRQSRHSMGSRRNHSRARASSTALFASNGVAASCVPTHIELRARRCH